MTGGCTGGTNTATGTIIVNANPTVTGTTSLCVGSTGQLTGSGTPATSNAWVSSNASVATVSTTGLVTGVAAGTATITYTNNNGCSVISTVTVNANPTILGSTSLCVGGTSQLTGSGTAATTNPWLSSNTSVATVSNTGLVTTLSSGTTTITYTNNNGCQATATITVTTSPSASISYVGSPFCSSLTTAQPVTLTGTTGGTYSSTAGLSLSASTGTITPASSTPGTYTITYTTPASGGCSAFTTITPVTITAAPTASISYSGSSFCNTVTTNQSVSLTGTGSYTGGTYSSTTGLTLDAVTGAITPSTSTPGTYTITYTTPASGGCSTITATTTVTITAIPTASITYSNTSYCTSTTTTQSVSLTGTGSYTGGTYSSSTGLSLSASTGAITPSTSTPGTYTVIYTTPASGGCSSGTTTTVVTINPSVGTPGTITGTSTQCSGATGQTYSISAVTNATTYTWTVPTGWTITAGQGTNSILVTTGTAGQNGNITVTAENSCGISSASALAVTVGNAAPSTPGSIAGITTLCVGSTSQTYSVSAVTNATTYSWTVPTGWTITSGAGTNSIVVTPGTVGQNGLISVTAENDCGTSQASTLQVAVNALPTVNAGSDTTVCANDFPISLTATGNATSYSWNTGANTVITTITAAGTYTVTGTLNGCSSTDNVVVISDPCAGIEENQGLTFKLYPNPSNTIINIQSNSVEEFNYSIYSIEGKILHVGVMNNGITTISIDNFAPGKYFTKIGSKVISFEVTQ
jgi:hypothetical protein